MASKFVYFTGPCKWAKLDTPDSYKGEEKWKINVYLNKETKKLLKESGLGLKVREDDDGEFVTFSRPTEKRIKGKLTEFEKPKLIDAEKNELDCLIGNGSVVTAKVLVYDTPDGPSDKGHRLEAVRVDNLIEYSAPEGEF